MISLLSIILHVLMHSLIFLLLQKFSPDEVVPIDKYVVEVDIELFGDAPFKIRLSIIACFELGIYLLH